MTKTKSSVPVSGSITERAMLVSLNIQQWVGAKHDKKITREVAEQHKSDESMGTYKKRLVGKEALEKIRQIAGAARAEHNRRTLPWVDGGTRILSSAGYFEYSKKMREFEAQFQPAVDEFLAQYPDLIVQARQRLNGLFNVADYPKPSAMPGKFGFNVNVLPMPSAADFRVELGDSETARVRAEIEKSVNESMQAAMSDVWQRIHDVVAHMHERLTAYGDSKPESGVRPFFLNSLVTNIQELVAILPTLNVTQDAKLAKITKKLDAQLCAHTPEQLRENDGARKETIKSAAAILDEMSEFI